MEQAADHSGAGGEILSHFLIRYGVATGSLKVGEQLPTVRALAVQLKVNLNTVSKAYRELEIQNVLETQQGTGTFIESINVHISDEERQSKQAQAERERQARIILGTAETEISEKFAEASKQYHDNPVALQLHGMNMLFEGLKEKGSLIIVPSSALESMNLGAMGGLAALSEMSTQRKELSE